MQILDAGAFEGDIVPSHTLGHRLAVGFSQIEHGRIEIHADDPALRSHNLRNDVTDLAAAAAQVEHSFALAYEARRIAAAVIAVEDFLGDDLEIFAVVFHRTAQGVLAGFRRRLVTFQDFLFGIKTDNAHMVFPCFRVDFINGRNLTDMERPGQITKRRKGLFPFAGRMARKGERQIDESSPKAHGWPHETHFGALSILRRRPVIPHGRRGGVCTLFPYLRRLVGKLLA